MYRRPKQQTIYGTTQTFYKQGDVRYVAHAITANSAIALGKVQQNVRKENTTEEDHPDRIFWSGNHPSSLADLLSAKSIRNAADLVRIEIDCSLMPCDAEPSGCLFKVPKIIEGLGYPQGLPVYMFSHRDEDQASDGESTKRVIKCKLGDSADALRKAYAANEDWSWVS